jgi:hypothetical protein
MKDARAEELEACASQHGALDNPNLTERPFNRVRVHGVANAASMALILRPKTATKLFQNPEREHNPSARYLRKSPVPMKLNIVCYQLF